MESPCWCSCRYEYTPSNSFSASYPTVNGCEQDPSSGIGPQLEQEPLPSVSKKLFKSHSPPTPPLPNLCDNSVAPSVSSASPLSVSPNDSHGQRHLLFGSPSPPIDVASKPVTPTQRRDAPPCGDEWKVILNDCNRPTTESLAQNHLRHRLMKSNNNNNN